MGRFLQAGNTSSLSNSDTSSNGIKSSNNSLECPIVCLHGSKCTRGNADFHFHPHYENGEPFPFHVETNRNGFYCECALGLTGINCGRKFETCGSTGHVCYHGGRCIEGLENIHPLDDLFCNCTDAAYAHNQYIGK